MKGLSCIFLWVNVFLLFTGFQLWAWNICPFPHVPENGHIKRMDRYAGGNVTFQCDEGYWYPEPSTWYCSLEGEWDGTATDCKEVECHIDKEPAHGKIMYSTNGYLDEGYVECDMGFIYTEPDSNIVVCQGDNTWSQRNGVCQKVECHIDKEPAHGKIMYSTNGYLDEGYVECDMGFIYTEPDSNIVVCQGDNTWSQRNGVCQRISCPKVPDVENGIASSSAFEFGSSVTFYCIDDYVLEGHGNITCQSNGNWSAEPGHCVEKQSQQMYLLLLLLLLLFLPLIYYLVRTRDIKRKSKTRVGLRDIETGPSQRYCSFIYEKEFKSANTNQNIDLDASFISQLENGIRDIIQGNTGKDVELNITRVSPLKKKIFAKINCQDNLEETEIHTAFNMFLGIRRGSVRLIDHITYALNLEIIHQKNDSKENRDIPVDLETQYVRLKILSKESLTTIGRDQLEFQLPHRYQNQLEENLGEDIADEDVITPSDSEKYVLIRGRAGIGKSTLVQRLLWRWAHAEWAVQFKAIFLLNVRTLMVIKDKLDLPTILSKYSVYNMRHYEKVQAKWLEDSQQNIAIILDGLDEIYNFKHLWDFEVPEIDIRQQMDPVLWGFSLMKRKCLPALTLVVTSRPFADLSFLRPTMIVEVLGLTRDRVLEFIKKNVHADRRMMVRQTLEKSPILLSVSAITFYCAALCQVLGEDKSVTDNLTTYTQITAYIVEMFMIRSMKGESAKSKEMYEELSECIRSMSKLAHYGLMDRTAGGVKILFDEEDFRKNDLGRVQIEKARRSGLFLQTEIGDATDSQVIGQFVHLSIQEFLAMVGILAQHPDDVKMSLEKLSSSGQFNMSLLFLYGIVFDETNKTVKDVCSGIGGKKEVRESICRILQKDIHDVSNKLQAIQMVHESQSPEVARQMGKKRFPKELNLSGIKLTVVDMLALKFISKHHHLVTSIELYSIILEDKGAEMLLDAMTVNTMFTVTFNRSNCSTEIRKRLEAETRRITIIS